MEVMSVEQRLWEVEAEIEQLERNGKEVPASLVRESITLAEQWEESQRVK